MVGHISEVVIRPILTEKTSGLTDQRNVYCFEVKKSASKTNIKSAIEKYFNVKVNKVTTSTLPGKVKRTKKGVKKSSSYKKAYVFVDQGQKIELFKGI